MNSAKSMKVPLFAPTDFRFLGFGKQLSRPLNTAVCFVPRSKVPKSTELTQLADAASPSRLSPANHPRSALVSLASSATLPPAFARPAPQSAGQSSATLVSPIRPSAKLADCTSPPQPPSSLTLPPSSAFTPICPPSPHSPAQRLPSTPPTSQPASPRLPQRSSNQLSVSSSHNSLDGEVPVSDIYFVSSIT